MISRKQAIGCIRLAVDLSGVGGVLSFTDEEYKAMTKIIDELLEEENKKKYNMKEDLYKWYPIVDEGEYWLEDEINPKVEPESMRRIYKDNIVTIVTNGEFLFNNNTSYIGWGTMAKQGNWRYMRIKLN